MFGKPASRRSGLKCFLTRYSSFIGSPRAVVKIRSANAESETAELCVPSLNCRSRPKTQLQFYYSTTSSPLRVRKGPLHIVPVNRPNDTHSSAIPVDVPPAKGKVLAGTHPGCKGYSKQALLRRMCHSPQK